MTPESFAAFWQIYPRKVARKAAEKAWMRIATSEALIEQIMAGLRAQLPGPTFNPRGRDKSFIPYPATWLNQRRWEDERQASSLPDRRVIACEKCGDTGAMIVCVQIRDGIAVMEYGRCSCRIGQLPGVLAGVEESA